jgi:hypothetical protein
MGTQNTVAREFGVSRDEVDVSVANLVKAGFASPPGVSPFTNPMNVGSTFIIVLTPFGREFLRIVLD